MKLLVIADIDDLHWSRGNGHADVLLSCGDVADPVILEAAQAYGCSLVLAVKGNHDTNSPFPHPITDLHLQRRGLAGTSFGGMNGSWRYKPRGHFLYEQAEAQTLLRHFPPVDVFISHNSPRGIHDREDDVHYGFEALNSYVARAKPGLLIHGHQHVNEQTQLEATRIIGVYGHALIDV